jgi:type I restriction enzyme S subunit
MSEFVETPLGILLRSWQIKPLGETTTKIQDGTHFSPQTDEGPCLYLTSKNIKFGRFDITDCGWISQQEHDAIYARCDVKYGDVLLTKDGANTGNACLNNLHEPFSLLSSVAFLRTDGVLNHAGFILQYLLSPLGRRRLKDLMSGNAIPRLTLQKIKAFKTPVPTPHEQRRIATILSTLDEVIEATEELVEKHQQIKAGLMHDLFTRGLWTRAELACGDHKGLPCAATAKEGQLRPKPEEAPGLYQDSPLGLIPKTWKAELLDILAKRGSGHTPNRHTPNFWDGGIKWVSLADSANLDQLYISETEKEISLLGIENSSAVLHPPGIVVLSRDAGVGKSAITTCPMAVSQHFMCWLCGPELDNHYLYYWLQDQKRVFENISTGTTIPTIGLGFFRRYKIAVPLDMNEQQAIRSSLLSVDETLFALKHDLAKLRQQKQGLMHDLLTGRVRVDASDTHRNE